MKMWRSNRLTILSVFLLCFSLPLVFSQESNSDSDKAGIDPKEEILLYGIDSELLGILAELQSEKNAKYNHILSSLIAETKDPTIIQGIFRLWDDTSFTPGFAYARDEISKVIEGDDYTSSVVQAAMTYLANQGDSQSLPLYGQLLSFHDTAIVTASIRAIGKMADDATKMEREELGENLKERLLEEDPGTEDELYAALIVSLGSLRYEPAADELIEIVEDSAASAGHRRLACVSVGRIGRNEDFVILERVYYESDDATLRAYALAGMTEFANRDMSDNLVQALKRDSFWRIRLTAAENLAGSHDEEVLKLLKYKAANDPVSQVRIASLKSIAATGGPRNHEFILSFFQNRQKSTEMRLAALDIMLENRVLGTNEAIHEVMDELWDKDEGRFLEFVCKNLSESDWPHLAPVFDRMLSHAHWLIQVYAVRGIRRSDILSLQERLDAMDAEGTDERLRREIRAGR